MGLSMTKFYPIRKLSPSTKTSMPIHHNYLPPELLLDILPFLARNEIEKCQLISRYFYATIFYNNKILPLRKFRHLAILSSNKIFYLSRDASTMTRLKFKSIIKKLNPEHMKYCIVEEFSFIKVKSKEKVEVEKMCDNLEYVINLFGKKIKAINTHMLAEYEEVFVRKFGSYLETKRLGSQVRWIPMWFFIHLAITA